MTSQLGCLNRISSRIELKQKKFFNEDKANRCGNNSLLKMTKELLLSFNINILYKIRLIPVMQSSVKVFLCEVFRWPRSGRALRLGVGDGAAFTAFVQRLQELFPLEPHTHSSAQVRPWPHLCVRQTQDSLLPDAQSGQHAVEKGPHCPQWWGMFFIFLLPSTLTAQLCVDNQISTAWIVHYGHKWWGFIKKNVIKNEF